MKTALATVLGYAMGVPSIDVGVCAAAVLGVVVAEGRGEGEEEEEEEEEEVLEEGEVEMVLGNEALVRRGRREVLGWVGR